MERFRDRPFAVLGVNSNDGTRDEVVANLARNGITWRNAVDGDPGRITTEWNVHLMPTVYVLDANGVIRARGDLDGDLDAIVGPLLDEIADGPADGR